MGMNDREVTSGVVINVALNLLFQATKLGKLLSSLCCATFRQYHQMKLSLVTSFNNVWHCECNHH